MRDLASHYLVVYIDATFVPTRREHRVTQEAYYSMLGALPDGTREVLAIVNHPTEGAVNWQGELKALQVICIKVRKNFFDNTKAINSLRVTHGNITSAIRRK